MASRVKDMTSGRPIVLITTFALPLLVGETGVFFAEVLAWFGADVILPPAILSPFGKGKNLSNKRRNII